MVVWETKASVNWRVPFIFSLWQDIVTVRGEDRTRSYTLIRSSEGRRGKRWNVVGVDIIIMIDDA